MFASILALLVIGCEPEETVVQQDFAFDGSCINCHAGVSAAHTHQNYKLRCVDCHGGNDQQLDVSAEAFKNEAEFRDPVKVKEAHVNPDPVLAHFFYANGIDDDNDGTVDEGIQLNAAGNVVEDFGENIEPALHGEGVGEFFDTELNRDLNYTRFLNPGDLRVATISCGSGARGALEGGGGGACHQQVIDTVRAGIMVNQAAVTNGAYYGNESWRPDFINTRDEREPRLDPRNGAFGYQLDYEGPDNCIDKKPVEDDIAANGKGGRVQPVFDRDCLQDRAAGEDGAVAVGAPGNIGINGANLPAFEIAQGTIEPAEGSVVGQSLFQAGAGDTRLPWGGLPTTGDENPALEPLLNDFIPEIGDVPGNTFPDPVDLILRTFRAYYPLNYPGSTTNFNFTFGTSIVPEVQRFVTANPYGRGHSSGCAACHAPYAYDGSRKPIKVRQDDGTVLDVVDPTTKHREFNPATDDFAQVPDPNNMGQLIDSLVGRVVFDKQQKDGRNGVAAVQQKTYSENHQMTTKIDTKTCGLCHGFVTRINYAYQGMAEEEQRDALARRAPIEFTTPAGTQVQILDSWVRIDKGVALNQNDVIIPDGVEVVTAARKRDADLKALGLIAGAGGCAQEQFSEDCNNNGELDTTLVLERVDEDGDVIASTTINEDANGNGKLDLIDRLPREESIDGRQVRYVYGGRNGSTRQMDVHFERGMHCIDCHFLQDVHGDGHVYSTNWDALEIECDDCHGGIGKATLITSGPNGGNDLTRPLNDDRVPFFERTDDGIIQRSRVTNGLFWKVPQTADSLSPYAIEAHSGDHLADLGKGSEFDGPQGQAKLIDAKVECAACHGSWVHNCVGCHVEVNIGDPQRKTVAANGNIAITPGENEVWLSNANNPGHINFQLLGLLRSPLVLGVSSLTEKGMLGPFRSSMQAHVSVSDGNGDLVRDNLTFTTFQAKDGNSGRTNVATSGVAMNQTMPHTVRPFEARGCETCHSLVNEAGQTVNEHIIGQTYGIGTGALPFIGDWVIAAGNAINNAAGSGLELFEYKQENELAANIGTSQRFPGLIVNGGTRTLANVEPNFNNTGGIVQGAIGNDVLLIRNFNPTPGVAGGTELPTLVDLAVLAVNSGGQGRIVFTDISFRGHPTIAVRPSPNQANRVFVLSNNLPGVPTSLAHIAPDVSDPFVYAAVGAPGVSVVEINDVPKVGVTAAVVLRTVPVGGNATKLALAGDLLYVGTAEGTIEVMSLADPTNPVRIGGIALPGAPTINDMTVSGFLLYVTTNNGTTALALDDFDTPAAPTGANAITFVGPAGQGLSVFQGIVFVAAGANGIQEIDFRIPAAPVVKGNIVPVIAPGEVVNAVDVVVSRMPGQVWLLALENDGDVAGLKLDNKVSLQEKCYTGNAADPRDCALDLDFRDYPARSGRDPSFDPVGGVFDSGAIDPSAPPFFRQTKTLLLTGRRLARPALWEQLNTLTGRRYRDSFMPGSGTLSDTVMQRMRAVLVCETPDPSTDPTGLNALGFFIDNACVPFGTAAARRVAVCTSSSPTSPPSCRFELASSVSRKAPAPQLAPVPRIAPAPPPVRPPAPPVAAPDAAIPAPGVSARTRRGALGVR